MEQFGDPRLVTPELLPAPEKTRTLNGRRLWLVWAALAGAPGVYGFAVAYPELSLISSLGALFLGLAGAGIVAWLITRTADRHGVGFAILLRVVFGPVGAIVPLALRSLLGMAWIGASALAIGVWIRRLLVAAVGPSLPTWLRGALEWHLPGVGGPAIVSVLLAFALIALGRTIARGGVRRATGWAIAGLLGAVVLLLSVAVFGGVRTAGFGGWVRREPPWDASLFLAATVHAFGLTLPFGLVAADWLRFSEPRKGTASLSGVWFAGGTVALLGALIASACRAVLGKMWGDPIADAAGIGTWLGAAGTLAAIGLWLAVWPLFGLYSGAQALVGIAPPLGEKRAASVTATGAMILAVVLAYTEGSSWTAERATLWAMPWVGMLVADAVWRRGKLLLEDAYLVRGAYASVFGVTLSAFAAWAIGLALLPELGAHVPQFAASSGALRDALGPDLVMLTPVVAGGVAGAAYVLLALLERRGIVLLRASLVRLRAALKQQRAKRAARRKEAGKPRWSNEKGSESTNPHFVWLPSEKDAGPTTMDGDSTAAETGPDGAAEGQGDD